MKYLYPLLLLLLLNATAFSSDILNGISDAEQKFKNGKIQEGKLILDDLSNKNNLSDEDRAIIYNKIAWFQAELVGNFEYAKRLSNNVIQMPLNETHPAILEAKIRIASIKNYETKYRSELRMLRKIRMGASDQLEAKKNIRKLETFIENNPNFPTLEVAYHYLGKNYLYLEKYYKSKKYFSKALERKPGIIFLLPTQALFDTAEKKWNYFFVHTFSILSITILLILLLFLLYYSKFWDWFNLKSLISIPIVIVIWGLFLLICSWFLNYFIPDQKHLYLPDPQFIQSIPFSPGSGILITIFYYGIVGIIFSFLLSLATHEIMKPKTRLIVNSIILIIFFSAIFSVFYQKKCYDKSIFEERNDSCLPTLTGHIYFQELDYEPIILTNPRKFPDLTLDNTNDKYYVKWIQKQYSIINNKPLENEEKKTEEKK